MKKHWNSFLIYHRKNGKILDEQETSAKYILHYECQQNFLDEVEKKLDLIKKSIYTAPFDLKHPFPKYTGVFAWVWLWVDLSNIIIISTIPSLSINYT